MDTDTHHLLLQHAAVCRVVTALGDVAALARQLVKHIASLLGYVGRSVHYTNISLGHSQQSITQHRARKLTVQRYGKLGSVVHDAVNAELVGHVRHSILLVHLLRQDLHRAVFVAVIGECVPSLGQVAGQDLHEAVGVAVVVDGASLSWRPNEHELFGEVTVVSLHADKRRGYQET